MTSTATKMTDTLFVNGDDKRARLKLKPSYLDHLKALDQVHSKMQQSFKLLGISHAALVHQHSKKSNNTNADIKRSTILVPHGKRKSQRRSTFLLLHWLITTPTKEKAKAEHINCHQH
jgi:hypothetical protein